MADSVILRDEDVGRIGEYVKPWLRELVHQVSPRNEPDNVSTHVVDRMVRVEEELKVFGEALRSQGEELKTFGEALRSQGEELKTFGEELRSQGEELRSQGEELRSQREELRSQRELIGAQRELMDERFAFTKERFEQVDKRFTTLTWMIGVGFAVITSLTTVFALLA